MDLVKVLSEQYMKPELPEMNVGDTVRVTVRVKEGNRERNQAFEGVIIAKKHGGINETSRSAASPTTWAARRFSPFTLPASFPLKRYARARSEGRSCTISEAASARRPKSKSASDSKRASVLRCPFPLSSGIPDSRFSFCGKSCIMIQKMAGETYEPRKGNLRFSE